MTKNATTITSQIFTDKSEYFLLRAHWSRLMNSEQKRELSAAHHLLYLTLMGRDWRKGFTPVSNQRKLENGGFYAWKMFKALRLLHSAYHDEWLLRPFGGLVTPEMLGRIRQFAPTAQPYEYAPEDFRDGSYPFPSYNFPGEEESMQ